MGFLEKYLAEKLSLEPKERWFRPKDPIALFTLWLVIFTGLLFLATAGSALVLWRTDGTLHGQLKALERQLNLMEADQRPWMTLETKIISPFQTYSASLDIAVKNVGKSPAYDAYVAFKSFLPGRDGTSNVTEAKNFCESLRDNKSSGSTILPNESSILRTAISPFDETKTRGVSYVHEKMEVQIFGCLVYSIHPGEKRHFTGVIYHLANRGDNAGKFDPLESVNPDQVILATSGLVVTGLTD